MLLLPEQCRTVGDDLPLFASPLWRRELLSRRIRAEFWRGFWWAAWAGLCVGAWGGWLAAQIRTASP